MNGGMVNLAELRKNFAKADYSDGKSSFCFIIGDKLVKVYAKKKDDYYPENVCDFSNFTANTIVFPNKYIRENGRIVAEILDYIKSDDITKSFNDEAILQVMTSGYDDVIQDMFLYSNIYMIDLCTVNILFSNELGYHLIDTTEWKMADDLSNNCPLKYDIKRFNYALISAVSNNIKMPIIFSKYYNKIDDAFYKNMAKYGNAGKRLQESMNFILNDRFNFLRMMYAFMETYRIHFGQDPKTLGEIKEFVKVLKKG